MPAEECKGDVLILATIRSQAVRGRVTFRAESQERTTLTISAESAGFDEAMRSSFTSLMERSARNIKHLIESEV
jgi:hypothetical protein